MTRSETAADIRTIAASSITTIAALALWGAVAPATVGYIGIQEATGTDWGLLLALLAVIVVSGLVGGAVWSRGIEHVPLRRDPDGPEDPDETWRKKVRFASNAAGYVAGILAWRNLTYSSATTFLGDGGILRVFIPADIARGVVLGAAAYGIVRILAVGVMNGMDDWLPAPISSHHS